MIATPRTDDLEFDGEGEEVEEEIPDFDEELVDLAKDTMDESDIPTETMTEEELAQIEEVLASGDIPVLFDSVYDVSDDEDTARKASIRQAASRTASKAAKKVKKLASLPAKAFGSVKEQKFDGFDLFDVEKK